MRVLDGYKLCASREHVGSPLLPVAEFQRNRSRPDGLQRWCRACLARASRRWAQANPEKRRGRERRWRQGNRSADRAKNARARQTVRDAVFAHYGRACVCCGATEKLTIDHVTGGGSAHRTGLFGSDSGGHVFYRWLVRQGFPPGYQVLCQPCDSSKHDGPACRLRHGEAS